MNVVQNHTEPVQAYEMYKVLLRCRKTHKTLRVLTKGSYRLFNACKMHTRYEKLINTKKEYVIVVREKEVTEL